MARGLNTQKRLLIIFSIVVCLLLASLPAHASQPLIVVESFKEDKVHLDIGDMTHVTRTLVIQNHINSSVVPGQITIALQKMSPQKIGPIALPFSDTLKPLTVVNVTATLGDGTPITDVRVEQMGNVTIIMCGAWVPIEANGTLTVILSYDSPDIVDKGILFNTVEYPFSTSTIPTDKAVIEANIDGHATHFSEPATSSGKTYVWEKDQVDAANPWSVNIEYSMLPLPLLPFKGSMILWGIVLLICLAWIVWTFTRSKKK